MATMYDTPMHDFSQENTMDADMLASATSDADWLQVENMMEDGDPQKPLPQEVDMSHDDVQEFEMRDADAELGDDFGQVPLEHSRHLFRSEPQDQEIPDASRAPSPGAAATIPLQILSEFSEPVGSDQESDQALPQPSADVESAEEVTAQVTQDPSTAHQSNELKDESTTHPEDVVSEHLRLGGAGNVSTTDNQDNSTISGESTRSPQVRPQQEEPQQTLVTLENTDAPVALAHDDNDDPSEVNLDSQGAEITAENQATEADDDGLLIDPPPPVLLVYPFDGSHFSLFNLPEISRPSDAAPDLASEELSTLSDGQAAHGSSNKHEVSESYLAASDPDHAGFPTPVLLFRERFALYYEPLSLVFEALRADNDFNIGGRFDDNVELMISAPELDLNLPEDSIHSREVSLHDFGVLHSGCELSGHLSLRLETVSPRFGTRYKAIRDEIFRVVSQQEEQEQQNLLVSGDEYLGDSPFHTSPENHLQDGTSPYQRKRDIEHTEVGADSGESYLESSGSRLHEQDASRTHDTSEDGKGEETQEGDPSDHLPQENFVTHDHDQSGVDAQSAEEGYAEDEEEEGFNADYDDQDALYDGVEDQEQEFNEVKSPREERQELAVPPDDPNHPPDTTGEVPDALDDSVGVFDDAQLTVNGHTDDHAGISPAHTAAVDISDAPESNTNEIFEPLDETPESQARSLDAAVHDYDSHTNALSEADSSRTEEKDNSRSRSGTPRPLSDSRHGRDELIAYEDAVNDENSQILPTSTHRADSQAASTASKRSYDDLVDQLDGPDSLQDDSAESKRLRKD